MLNKEEIIDLIENGSECEYLDYKLEEYNKNKYHELLKDLIAFANSHSKQDKYIIIGMKKKNNVIEFNSLETVTDDADYQDIMSKYVNNSINFKYEPFKYNEYQLAVLTIYANNYDNRLFRFKKNYERNGTIIFKDGESFIRKGSSTSIPSDYDLKKIFNSDQRESSFVLQSFKDEEIYNNIMPFNFGETYEKIIEEQKANVETLIKRINEIKIIIPKQDEVIVDNTPTNTLLSALIQVPDMFKGKAIEKVTISTEIKNIITSFCEYEKYEINNDFFDIGNLELYEKMDFSGGMPYAKKYVKGTDEEELKYELINKLHKGIKKYVNIRNYINKVKDYSYLKLVLSNIGNMLDEDIIVTLYIPKGCLCSKTTFNFKDEFSASLFNEIYEKILTMKATPEIKIYEKSVLNGVAPTIPTPRLPNLSPFGYSYGGLSDKDEIIIDAEDNVEEIFCYEELSNADYDVLRFETNKLIHNTKMFFPEVIIFKTIPNEIKYEIKSKQMKGIKTGVITL